MNDSRPIMAVIHALISGALFGIWMRSLPAGVFAFTVLAACYARMMRES